MDDAPTGRPSEQVLKHQEIWIKLIQSRSYFSHQPADCVRN